MIELNFSGGKNKYEKENNKYNWMYCCEIDSCKHERKSCD